MCSDEDYAVNYHYHIYNRGCRRQRIVFEQQNYDYLTRLLSQSRNHCDVTVTAYVIMPNHYHLLIRQHSSGQISSFLRKTFQSYSQAINRQQELSGRMFESRPKAVKIEEIFRCLHLCRYIHMNPVEAGLVRRPVEWEYSNFRECIGMRESLLWNPELIHSYFPAPDSYRNFVLQALKSPEPHDAIEQYLLE